MTESFATKYVPEPNSGCHIWTARVDRDGYGRFDAPNQRAALAHRYAYKSARGPIQKGLTIDHLCRVRCCVNPAHMEVVTRRVNTLRGDTIPARHAAKTSCPRGHAYVQRGRQRRCLVCEAAAARSARSLRREVA